MDNFSPSYRGKSGTWCRACFAAYNRGESRRKPHDPLTCQHCGGLYEPLRLSAKAAYCSRECKTEARNAAEKAARIAAKAAAAERLCPQCGEPLRSTKRVDAVFCSQRCNLAAHRVNVQIRKGQHPDGVTVGSLGDRDHWHCGICRQPVDRSLSYPHPLSPSVDHAVSVAQSGGDDLSNLRLTHLLCNLRRGDGASHDVVRLRSDA